MNHRMGYLPALSYIHEELEPKPTSREIRQVERDPKLVAFETGDHAPRVFYVDAEKGKDSYPGTFEKPRRTINAPAQQAGTNAVEAALVAAPKFKAGDIVRFNRVGFDVPDGTEGRVIEPSTGITGSFVRVLFDGYKTCLRVYRTYLELADPEWGPWLQCGPDMPDAPGEEAEVQLPASGQKGFAVNGWTLHAWFSNCAKSAAGWQYRLKRKPQAPAEWDGVLREGVVYLLDSGFFSLWNDGWMALSQCAWRARDATHASRPQVRTAIRPATPAELGANP